MTDKLAYCKTKEFDLESNINRNNRTVDIYKIVGNEIMSDKEYNSTNRFMNNPDATPSNIVTNNECSNNENKRIWVGEFTNTDIKDNMTSPDKDKAGEHFYGRPFYKDYIVRHKAGPEIRITGKSGVDVAAGIKTTILKVGRSLDVKLEDPRIIIVNPARNNVNLDVGVNPDVDVVKFFILVNIFLFVYFIKMGDNSKKVIIK